MCQMNFRIDQAHSKLFASIFFLFYIQAKDNLYTKLRGRNEIHSCHLSTPICSYIRPKFFPRVHLFVLFELGLGMCLFNAVKSLREKKEGVPPYLLLWEISPYFPHFYWKRRLSLALLSVDMEADRQASTDSLILWAHQPAEPLPSGPSAAFAVCRKEKLEIKFTLCSQRELILIKCPGQIQ